MNRLAGDEALTRTTRCAWLSASSSPAGNPPRGGPSVKRFHAQNRNAGHSQSAAVEERRRVNQHAEAVLHQLFRVTRVNFRQLYV
jgi:hypothetical protein